MRLSTLAETWQGKKLGASKNCSFKILYGGGPPNRCVLLSLIFGIFSGPGTIGLWVFKDQHSIGSAAQGAKHREQSTACTA